MDKIENDVVAVNGLISTTIAYPFQNYLWQSADLTFSCVVGLPLLLNTTLSLVVAGMSSNLIRSQFLMTLG